MFPDITTLELNTILAKLAPSSPALWGKMSAQHMLEHLSDSLKYSNGTLELQKPSVSDRIYEKMMAFLLSDKPFPHGFMSPLIGETLLPLRNDTFESAKNELLSERLKFSDFYWKNPVAVFFNPIFGNLNHKEWLQFHAKHFYHHFSQFGLT